MSYTKTPSSGLLNIKITKEGSASVTVLGAYLGTFKDRDLAIKRRDEHRAKNNLPKPKDSSC